MDFEAWFEIHTNISYFETASLKTIYTLKLFCQFCDNCKIPSFTHHVKGNQVCLPIFKRNRRNHNKVKSLYIMPC